MVGTAWHACLANACWKPRCDLGGAYVARGDTIRDGSSYKLDMFEGYCVYVVPVFAREPIGHCQSVRERMPVSRLLLSEPAVFVSRSFRVKIEVYNVHQDWQRKVLRNCWKYDQNPEVAQVKAASGSEAKIQKYASHW